MAGPRTAGIFQDSMQIFLRNRPQIHGVRNPTLPTQVSGDFAEFRQIWRNLPESRSFTAEPAGQRVREQPKFFRIPCRYFYTIGHRFMGRLIPLFPPK